MVKKANPATDGVENDGKLKISVARVLFLLEAAISIDPKGEMSSYLDAHAKLTAFLHGLCNGSHTLANCQPRNSLDTRFIKLVRNFVAVRGEKSATKAPVRYNPTTRVVSFPGYLDTGICPLIQALIELRILLEEKKCGQ